MFNYLELAYSPISNNVFSIIKDDERFRQLTQKSTLYVIAQRGELTLNNFHFGNGDSGQLFCLFEIKQKGNPSVLNCVLPLYQPAIASDITREIKFHFEYALPKPDPIPQTFPQQNIVNLLLYYHDDTFISWISAENFIQNYLRGAIDADIEGPVEDFLQYKVHYVGKATEQNVWQRLTGHVSLQQILSQEYPLHFGTLPTHEIALLFFKFRETFKMDTMGPGDKITTDFVDTLMARNQPNERTISLDAEKALINAMQPKYNREFYRNYPKSTNGLYPYGLDAYSFRIHSPIILEYNNGRIKGVPNLFGGDSIIIEKGQPLKVINEG
jgi:hypothetical protein